MGDTETCSGAGIADLRECKYYDELLFCGKLLQTVKPRQIVKVSQEQHNLHQPYQWCQCLKTRYYQHIKNQNKIWKILMIELNLLLEPIADAQFLMSLGPQLETPLKPKT